MAGMANCLVDDVENVDDDEAFIFIVDPPLKKIEEKYLLGEEEDDDDDDDVEVHNVADRVARENVTRTVVVAENNIDVVATRRSLIVKTILIYVSFRCFSFLFSWKNEVKLAAANKTSTMKG